MSALEQAQYTVPINVATNITPVPVSWMVIQNIDPVDTVYFGNQYVTNTNYGFSLAPGQREVLSRMSAGMQLYAYSTTGVATLNVLQILF
jgi:hypothetical protein